MSRLGKRPVSFSDKVSVKVENNTLIVKGEKGELRKDFPTFLELKVEDGSATIVRPDDSKKSKTFHGTYWAHLNNMITGVTVGFTKKLNIVGVGYRGQMQGSKLVLNLGYSHPVEYTPINGVTIETPTNLEIIVTGIDKELVGSTAAQIRDFRKPEPYKGKGIRYSDEIVRKKQGKKQA